MSDRVCQRETLAQARPDIEKLAPEHWQAWGDTEFTPNPLWPFYENMEKLGKLLLLSVRQDGEMIGYAAGFTHVHLNSCHNMVGSVPTYFVRDVPGRVFIQKSLLHEMARRLFALGAKRVYIETRAEIIAARLLETMGGKPNKVVYEFASATIKQEAANA